MHRLYMPCGVVAAFCLATSGCAAPTNNETAAQLEPAPEIEQDLALTVDALDVRHGTLRIEASMDDGSADVSMWLGPACEKREVGHGIATRSGFAWSLSRDEIARAIECSLVVRVHGVDEDGQRVVKSATLPVGVAILPDGAQNVRLHQQEADGASTKLTFIAKERAPRFHVAGTVIGAEPYDDALPVKGFYTSSFVVGNDDLARSMLNRRRLTVVREHFLATISVGSTTLDVSEPEEQAPIEIAEPAVKGESEIEGPQYYSPSYGDYYDGDYGYGDG